MKKSNLKKIPNAVSRRKKKYYQEYSKFEILFSIISILTLLSYYIFLHPLISNFFNYSVYVLISEFWIFTPTIFILHRHFKINKIENKFSSLYKDLNLKTQIPYENIISKYSNYDKEFILKKSEFSNENIMSYINVSDEIFQIKCSKKDNQISLFSLNTEHSHYPMYIPSRELENYDSFEGLIYFYYKSIDYYNEKN